MARRQDALDRFRAEHADSLIKIIGVACEYSRHLCEGEYPLAEASLDAVAELVMAVNKKAGRKHGHEVADGGASNVTPLDISAARPRASGD